MITTNEEGHGMYRSATARHRLAQHLAEVARQKQAVCPHPFRDGCPDGPWTCMTCGHREPGTCTSDHGPESR